jgi:hypothetical protein
MAKAIQSPSSNWTQDERMAVARAIVLQLLETCARVPLMESKKLKD